MGTWNAEILGNDTSAAAFEALIAAYNAGAAVATLAETMRRQFAKELAIPGESDQVILALALGLWEVGGSDEGLQHRIEAIVAHGVDESWRDPTISSALRAERRKHLEHLLLRLRTTKPRPRPRRRPPVVTETPFEPGTCAAFPYPDYSFGGVIVVERGFTRTKGRMGLALTSLRTPVSPTLSDFLGARWLSFTGEVHPEGAPLRVLSVGLGYERAAERPRFLELCASFFTIVGSVPLTRPVQVTTIGIGVTVDNFELLARRIGDQCGNATAANSPTVQAWLEVR